jgi:hypothetical protein
MFGTLCKIVQISPVLPMLAVNRPVQPIHLDEVCKGLLALTESQRLVRPIYHLASSETVFFGKFLQILARVGFQRSLWLFPLPLKPILWAVKLVNLLPLPIKVDQERILGLAKLPVCDSAEDLAELELIVSPFATGLVYQERGKSTRRRLLGEGFILMRYLLGGPPSRGHLKLYVMGVENSGSTTPLELPALTRRFPPLLALFDPICPTPPEGKVLGELKRRLGLASLVLDASAHETMHAYDYQGRGKGWAFSRLILTGLTETLLFPLRFLLGRNL